MFYLKPISQDTRYFLTTGKLPDIPAGMLRERGTYELVYQGEALPKLLISGSEVLPYLKELRPEENVIYWRLNIEDHAGEISLELEDQTGESLGNWILDIAPHPGKLGRDAYYELLEDLNNKYEGLVFDVGSAYTEVNLDDGRLPLLARYFLLKTFIVPLERAFRTIESAPQRILIAERATKKLHQLRKFENNTLRQATRIPGMTMFWRQETTSTKMSFNPSLETSVREETFNTPANRYLLTTLNRVIQAVSEIERGFTELQGSQRSDEMQRSRIKKYLDELPSLDKRIKALSMADFLKGLKPAQADTATMLAISGNPAYSRLDRITRRILCPQANLAFKEMNQGDYTKTSLQLRSTWEIYELWVFISLVEIVQEIWPKCKWHMYKEKTDSFIFSFDNNTKVIGRSDNLEIVLTYQKEYRSYDPKKSEIDNYHSISKAFRPDFTISINDSGIKKLIILDAKYRTSRESIQEALREIHIYRDAIRHDISQTQAQAVFIIAPNTAPETARFFEKEYRSKYNFGGFILSLQDISQREQMKREIKANFCSRF